MPYKPKGQEIALVSCCAVVLALDLALIIYVHLNRKYLPLKVKHLPSIYLAYVGAVFWFIGNTAFNAPSLFNFNLFSCVVYFAWIRMSLGVFLTLGVFLYRVYSLVCIFKWERRPVGRYFWWLTGSLVVASFTYALVAMALSDAHGFSYDEASANCKTGGLIYYFATAIIIILVLAIIVLTFMARRINSCFNESKELLILTFTITALMAVSIATQWITVGDNRAFWIRAVNMVLMVVVCNVFFLIVLGPPAYYSIFDREEYHKRFMHKLVKTDLWNKYDAEDCDTGSSLRFSFTTSYGSEDAVRLNFSGSTLNLPAEAHAPASMSKETHRNLSHISL
ncbi:hypothetical protein DL89DRAFT_265231, partial [Linderina pennispora]